MCMEKLAERENDALAERDLQRWADDGGGEFVCRHRKRPCICAAAYGGCLPPLFAACEEVTLRAAVMVVHTVRAAEPSGSSTAEIVAAKVAETAIAAD